VTSLTVAFKAELDLLEIEQYSFDNFGAAQANDYMDMIERVFDRLLAYPDSGPIYPGVRPPVRYVSAGKHRAFYDYDGRTIMIRRVLHQAMVPEDHL
jgi:toxin ParE1/3/4